MDDNARPPHRAKIINSYLNETGIEPRMHWPAMSPDLNPIEHLWDALQQALSKRPFHERPSSLHTLGSALQEEWDNLDQRIISKLIPSMRSR